MSELKPVESKNLRLAVGLHLLSYLDAVDSDHPPLVNIAVPMGQIDSQVSFLFQDPNNEGFLKKPYETAVVRVIGKPAEIMVGIFITSECKSAEIKFEAKPLTLDEKAPDTETETEAETEIETEANVDTTTVDLSPEKNYPLAFSGHVQWQGDVQLAAGEALGNPEKSWRIESFAIAWPDKPAEVDIEYYCYVNNLGESPKSSLNALVGTKARALPIAALSAQLIGANADRYELTIEVIFSETGVRTLSTDGSLTWGLHDNEYLTAIRGIVTEKVVIDQAIASNEAVVASDNVVENIWVDSVQPEPTKEVSPIENIWDDSVSVEAAQVPQNAWESVTETHSTEKKPAFTVQTS
ncbi:MAG: hypothetical protein KAU26_02575 [Methylococcales bacterium]|nr:hypothetical protein [Methylococcales bacterium]